MASKVTSWRKSHSVLLLCFVVLPTHQWDADWGFTVSGRCVYIAVTAVCVKVPQDFVFQCTAFFGVYHHPQQTVGCSVCSLPLPWVHDSQPQPDSACLSRSIKTKQEKERKKEKTFVRQHKCFHVQTCGACDCKCIIANVKSLNMEWMVVRLCIYCYTLSCWQQLLAMLDWKPLVIKF